MGKQYNPRIKRARRKRYQARKRARIREAIAQSKKNS